ncbi:hypothetical protein [Candidatus Similichlamydia epinepheli]|uniref:hypothetical protein n=1 Tax=Candidatus Similichlamydia epinepheli TaxID=1903953 RepID=UPI000D34DCEC|nr:hypothetical protein [Candidatus Similichlamydia epinepheli]
MFRKLLGALFGLSVVQSQDTTNNKIEKDSTVVEQVIDPAEKDVQQGKDLSLEQERSEVEIDEKLTLARPSSEVASRSEIGSGCRECPLHCFLRAESHDSREHRCRRSECWFSKKTEHFKTELNRLKNKISRETNVLKDKVKKIFKRDSCPEKKECDRRSGFRSR